MKKLLAMTLFATTAMAGAADFRLPAFDTTRLPNGLTVYLMERHDAPLIALGAVLKAGSVHDGAQPGLANLAGDALLLGSARHAKVTIDQAFDFRGATLGGASGAEQSSLVASFARDDAAVLMPMFADIVQQPRLDPAELDKLRARKVLGLKQAKEAPRNVVQAYYRGMLFGEGGYGNPSAGTVGSMAAITRKDVQDFQQRYYRPDNAAIIVVGDFKITDMRARIAELFGNWRASGPAPALVQYGKVKADKARVWLVNKPDATETTFMIGGPGIARANPDYVPLEVLNTVLGGRFTSWLNDELRINSGLTYGARSEFATLSQTGTFGMSSFTATAKTGPALELALKTYQRLWDKGIDAATLESAKAYVKGQFPPRFETSAQLAGLLADMFVANVSRAQFDQFNQDVDSLTPARAKQLVDQHFPRDKLQMLLIGKASEIRTLAAQYGEVTELDITADGFQPVK